jgi:hypothetical protein
VSASTLADLLARQLPPGLAARARALLDAQHALDRVLPPALAGHVRVMQLEDGILSLACDSGAVASRLRQQPDALIASLGRHKVAVASVRVSVNPERLARFAPPVDKPGLPAAALDGLAHLRAGLDDGPLKDALARLLQHHRRG